MRIFLILISLFFANPALAMKNGEDIMTQQPENHPIATLAGGCFWCLESEFRALDGILYTRVGYAGGHTENPTYEQVTTGKTGHAEAVEITFDPEKISYRDLLEFFFTKAHNPTTLNRQGVDVGPQYRSVAFYHDEEQKREIEAMIQRINMNKIHRDPIVTEILPATTFYEAEGYHQQYYEKYEEKTGKEHIRVQLKKLKRR